MKKIFFLLIISFSLVSCSGDSSKTSNGNEQSNLTGENIEVLICDDTENPNKNKSIFFLGETDFDGETVGVLRKEQRLGTSKNIELSYYKQSIPGYTHHRYNITDGEIWNKIFRSTIDAQSSHNYTQGSLAAFHETIDKDLSIYTDCSDKWEKGSIDKSLFHLPKGIEITDNLF